MNDISFRKSLFLGRTDEAEKKNNKRGERRKEDRIKQKKETEQEDKQKENITYW